MSAERQWPERSAAKERTALRSVPIFADPADGGQLDPASVARIPILVDIMSLIGMTPVPALTSARNVYAAEDVLDPAAWYSSSPRELLRLPQIEVCFRRPIADSAFR
jgi:hypothetical protein